MRFRLLLISPVSSLSTDHSIGMDAKSTDSLHWLVTTVFSQGVALTASSIIKKDIAGVRSTQ